MKMRGRRADMEIVLDTKDEVIYRFQSSCMDPGCAIDVTVMKNTPPEHPFVEFDFWDKASRFTDRLRWCWEMLTTGRGFQHEFFLRGEDIDDFTKVVRRAKFPFRSKA